MIVTSRFTEGPPQADLRRWVTETHVDDLGEVYTFEWLGGQDAGPVLEARAEKLTELLTAKRAAEAQVAGTRLPLTKLQFRQLFTDQERGGIDAFELSFEASPALDAATKAAIRTGFKDFNAATQVDVPFVPSVISMLGLFVQIGLLSEQRMTDIVTAHG